MTDGQSKRLDDALRALMEGGASVAMWGTPFKSPQENEADALNAMDEYLNNAKQAIADLLIEARIDELEHNKLKVCICDEAGVTECDALWHHRNNINSRIDQLKAQLTKSETNDERE